MSPTTFKRHVNHPTLGHIDHPTSEYAQAETQNYGATPNFELAANDLFEQQPNTALQSRSKSVPPQALGSNSDSNRIFETSRRLPRIDTAKKPIHSAKRRSYLDEAEKRPTSPHITSATPTSARNHVYFNEKRSSLGGAASPHDDHSLRLRSSKSPPPAGKMVSAAVRQSSGLGWAAVSAAQSLMDAVAGRVSPANLYHQRQTSLPATDPISDDEADKGHGRKALGRFTPSLFKKPTTDSAHVVRPSFVAFTDNMLPFSDPEEIDQGFSGDVVWRASISKSRRPTPAAYRPRPTTPRKRWSGAAQSGGNPDDSTDFTVAEAESSLPRSHSIQISSPIVVPQARRGAVRLRPKRRCRRRAKQQQQRLTTLQQVQLFIASTIQLFKLLSNPSEARHRLREWWTNTRISCDEAFRDEVTGARCWYPPWLQAYVPLLIWLGISLGSTVLVVTFHTQVFSTLDRLATELQRLGLGGRLILGSLIFLTTFPPLPLYSTLIILCGFSFGLWQGFIISYIAALSGAIVVFVLSRSLLKDWMVGLLNKSGGLKKVVRAIEKQPKLLFLVRLAPYPYNLMNTLLASSSTLTLKTYTLCTALALPKLMVHTAIGTSIKDFAAYNGAKEDPNANDADSQAASHSAETVKRVAGYVGIILCIGIFFYLLSVARRAVDELDDDDDDNDNDGAKEGEDQDLLTSDDEDDFDGQDAVASARESEEIGTDMREHSTARGTLRNGYAPVSWIEDRLRYELRHPTTGSQHDVSLHSFTGGSTSFEDHGSSGSLSGGPSMDLAERIAEMEAHAEGMELET